MLVLHEMTALPVLTRLRARGIAVSSGGFHHETSLSKKPLKPRVGAPCSAGGGSNCAILAKFGGFHSHQKSCAALHGLWEKALLGRFTAKSQTNVWCSITEPEGLSKTNKDYLSLSSVMHGPGHSKAAAEECPGKNGVLCHKHKRTYTRRHHSRHGGGSK